MIRLLVSDIRPLEVFRFSMRGHEATLSAIRPRTPNARNSPATGCIVGRQFAAASAALAGAEFLREGSGVNGRCWS